MNDWTELMNKTLNQNLRHWPQCLRFFVYLLLFIIVCPAPTAHAYQSHDYSWSQPSTTFYVDIPGENGLWNDAFEGSMYEWSENTVFQYYIIRGTYSNPCDASDDRNGVRFDSTNCGDAWGSSTLAITHTWYSGAIIIETDIVFNSNEPWDVYFGPWSYSVNDFRRVAVHELGHALGLGHEDSGVSTIMGTYAGDNTVPQQDDINGVEAIYGGGGYLPNLNTYYRDYDNDGYGDSASPYETSSQPSGYVSNNTDCNDYDSTIHPGAIEICGDGIDQDCNGSDKICVTQTQVAELYVATFNRAPDAGGLNYWVDSVLTIEQIAKSFFDQPETKLLYPTENTDAQFVTSIYQNLFNRAPDAAGLSYWIGPLGLGGGLARSVMIEALKNGATGTDRAIIDNKTEVGLYFANHGSQAVEFSLSDITDDPTTVDSAKKAVDDL